MHMEKYIIESYNFRPWRSIRGHLVPLTSHVVDKEMDLQSLNDLPKLQVLAVQIVATFVDWSIRN